MEMKRERKRAGYEFEIYFFVYEYIFSDFMFAKEKKLFSVRTTTNAMLLAYFFCQCSKLFICPKQQEEEKKNSIIFHFF